MVIGDGQHGVYKAGERFDSIECSIYWNNRGYELVPVYAAPVSVEAAVLAEREACAEVCDRFAENETGFVAEDCAAAIRARGNK